MAIEWYYLDPDNNRDDPDGLFCMRCKRKIKDTQSFESFLPIVIHSEHPWYRKASAFEKSDGLIGEDCHKKMIKEYGLQGL